MSDPGTTPTPLHAPSAALAVPSPRRLPPWLVLLFCVVSLAVMYGPTWADHVRHSSDWHRLNDDSRAQVWPLLRYRDPGVYPDDLFAEYYLSLMPVGHKAVYWMTTWGQNPRVTSKWLPYVLFAAFLGLVVATSHRLGGWFAAWGTAAIALGSALILSRMVGGLPRGHAFTIIAAVALGLVLDRVWVLIGAVIAGALLYPSAGVLAGLALTCHLLVLPAGDRPRTGDLKLSRRLALLILTAAVSAACLAPALIAAPRFGPPLGPGDLDRFPEIGPGGRHVPPDAMPAATAAADLLDVYEQTLAGSGRPWPLVGTTPSGAETGRAARTAAMMVIAAWLLAGTFLLAMRRPQARRLLGLLLAGILGHILAAMVAPRLYIPYRYVAYSLPVILVIVAPAAAVAIGDAVARRSRRPWLRVALSVMLLASCILVGNRNDPLAGLTVHVNPDRRLYDWLATLPADSRIAGWPVGVIDNVPYLAGRSVLLSYELHQVHHRGFALEMRRRMEAVVAAVFATDTRPLRDLRDRYGVTHLLIDRRVYLNEPPYFRPFQPLVHAAFENARDKPLAAEQVFPTAGVYEEGPVVVLDLHMLPGKHGDRRP
jgi:hypothetical protein